ncbi:MAG: hypothetical protein OXH76_03810 [Boseongicola sp.]|nr:hypothetical protein [Boseongicola sp.]
MPADVAFDTITTIQRLRGAGIEQAHAEAITASIRAGVTGGVATKADVELVQQELQTVKAELEGKIDALGAEMKTELKWIKIIGGTIVALLILPWLAALVGTTLPGP